MTKRGSTIVNAYGIAKEIKLLEELKEQQDIIAAINCIQIDLVFNTMMKSELKNLLNFIYDNNIKCKPIVSEIKNRIKIL